MSTNPLEDLQEISVEQKWRLILGKSDNGETEGTLMSTQSLRDMDATLEMLYGGGNEEEEQSSDRRRNAGLGNSQPKINRWLGDIRKYFPSSVVQVMQKDAYERLGLDQMLLEPELLQALEADINLVTTLIGMKNVIPSKTKETARMVVQKVVDELLKKLEQPFKQAIKGALNKGVRNNKPKFNEINWKRTIQLNMKHYQEEYKTIIPQNLVGYGKKGQSLKNIILCVDQSGSMDRSVVYSSIFGAVMASIPAVKTEMICFDTAVMDLTKDLNDPIDLLFATQLGGGTDIDNALAYVQGLVQRPHDTIMVLITDLYEGGNENSMLARLRELKENGVQCIILLALDDQGAPSYDRSCANKVSAMDIPVFGCSPDMFPDLMAAAIQKQDLQIFAQRDTRNLKK